MRHWAQRLKLLRATSKKTQATQRHRRRMENQPPIMRRTQQVRQTLALKLLKKICLFKILRQLPVMLMPSRSIRQALLNTLDV